MLAQRLSNARHPDIEGEGAAQGAIEVAGDVVVDDDPDGPGVVGIGRLDREGAGSPADQGDVAGSEPGEVRGFASEVGHHRHRSGDIATPRVGHDDVGERSPWKGRNLLQDRGGDLGEPHEIERLDRHVITRSLQPFRHVVG